MIKSEFCPYIATLTKIGIVTDSTDHQLDKYPFGTTFEGLVWEFNYPRVKERFSLNRSKMHVIFSTSEVREIIKAKDVTISDKDGIKHSVVLIITTQNSVYKLELNS